MNLIPKKSIFDIIGWIVVQDDHYDAADHLSDLMIDKALPYDVEDQVIFIQLFNREF